MCREKENISNLKLLRIEIHVQVSFQKRLKIGIAILLFCKVEKDLSQNLGLCHFTTVGRKLYLGGMTKKIFLSGIIF